MDVPAGMALAGLEKLSGANQIHCGLTTLTGSGRAWSKLLFDNPIMEASSASRLIFSVTAENEQLTVRHLSRLAHNKGASQSMTDTMLELVE